MSEPLVSVVTPFHNTQAYLAECIESVLAQSYQNFEYVLVDNQSTDDSGSIAARYAEKDRRIRVVRTCRLLNQVQNYNFSLSEMSPQSRYCKMIQADDYLFPRCLTEMVPLAEANPRVSIVSSYRLVEARVDCVGLHPRDSVVRGSKACRLHLFATAFLLGSPSTVLYRADVVRSRNPFFAEHRFHEDTEAAFEILEHSDLGFVHQVLSFSRRNEDSIMGKARDFHPYALDRFIIVKRYGTSFLDRATYETCLHEVTTEYYFGLAARWIADGFRTTGAFWDYQRRGLQTVQEDIKPLLLARYATDLSLRRVLSPLQLARDIRQSLRRTS